MLFRAKRVGGAQASKFVWPNDRAQSESNNAAQTPQAAQAASAAPSEMALAEIERDAFVKGYAQGERAGFEAGGQRVEAMLRRLAATIDELTTLRRSMMAQAEREMVELALAIARRVVLREVSIDRDLVVTIARVALERLGGTSATIRLHPDDHAAVTAQLGEAWAGLRVRIVPDDGVRRGGCKVESDCGFVDASIDAQFEQIARELVGGDGVMDLEHVGAAAEQVL